MMVLAQVEPVPNSVDSVLAPHIYVFYAAFIVSFLFTPVMRIIAKHYDIMDKPDLARKIHSAPVAYLGGVAVFLGWLAGLAFSQFHVGALDAMPHNVRVNISIVVGAMVVVLLGLLDDIHGVMPAIKIIVQAIAAGTLLIGHVGIHSVGMLVAPMNLRLAIWHLPVLPNSIIVFLSCIFVVLMVVGCCNATNLMDGLDGLCGGVTAVIAAGFLFLAVDIATAGADSERDAVRVVLALALLGGVLGFIPYNFNPASIFMGDAGSMFLGFACATMILLLAEQQSRWFLAAMVMFALPVLDTFLAMVRRYVNGRPIFSADRHHFHHQMVSRGLTVRQTVLLSYALAIGFTLLGALIVFIRTRYAGAIYLVTFGSIIVAAYKMGMVHEKPRIVDAGSVADGGLESVEAELEAGSVMEIRQTPAVPPRAEARPITSRRD
jgi:UDP-GlcNAc:undecaprenyl-phosphate/decaprenyl-phosphate GlcNAc-1-phosphate transferase